MIAITYITSDDLLIINEKLKRTEQSFDAIDETVKEIIANVKISGDAVSTNIQKSLIKLN